MPSARVLRGEDTPFADAKAVIGQVSCGGIAAMEPTARDLKALGVYATRSLSYDDVTCERLSNPLCELERAGWDELAGAWQVVLTNVDEALELTGGGRSPHAKSAVLSQFRGAHQRFCNQVFTALQTPAVIEHMRSQIDARRGGKPARRRGAARQERLQGRCRGLPGRPEIRPVVLRRRRHRLLVPCRRHRREPTPAYPLHPPAGLERAGSGPELKRTHRTNQASSPHAMLPTTDLAAQKRFVSSIARRLDQLGALTRGQRQTTSQGLFTASDNLASR